MFLPPVNLLYSLINLIKKKRGWKHALEYIYYSTSLLSYFCSRWVIKSDWHASILVKCIDCAHCNGLHTSTYGERSGQGEGKQENPVQTSVSDFIFIVHGTLEHPLCSTIYGF